jgi:hypothetical protein
MKKKLTLFTLTAALLIITAVMSSCSLIVAGTYKGGANTKTEETVEGVFEFKSNGKMTYKGQAKIYDEDGTFVELLEDVEYSGTYKVESGKGGIYYVYIEGKDQAGTHIFWGVKTYFEGRKNILVYWDGDGADAYVYKR